MQRCCRKAMLRVLPPTFKPVNNIICCKTGLMCVNATAVRKWRKWIHLTTGWRRDEHGTHKHAHGSWILCSVSRVRSKTMHSVCISHKSYLTLPCVISIQDPFCLGTFAHGFIRLPPCSLASSRYESLTLLFEFSKILSWFVHSIRLLDLPGIAIKLSVSQFLKQEELKTQKLKEKSREKSGQERAGPRWQNRNSEQFKWFFSVNEVQWTDFVFRILNTHCYHRESLELHQAISALTIFLLLRLSQHEVFSWQAVLVRESSCVFERTLPPYLYFLIRSDHRHKCESFDRCVAFKKTLVGLLSPPVFYKYSW